VDPTVLGWGYDGVWIGIDRVSVLLMSPPDPQPTPSPTAPLTETDTDTDAAPELQTLGFWATFLYYFTGTSLIAAITSAQALHLDLASGLPFQFGGLFGVLAGGVGAYYNRTTQVEIPIATPKTFNPKFAQTLQNMGYTAVDQDESETLPGYEVYRRSGLRHWFSGSLLVRRQPQQVKLYGRARINRQLQKLLG
jgi:hypothetical protein